MGDYPDWTRLFYLVGTDIVIPISIDAATVTLPVSIDAATVTIDVNLAASDVTLPVSIDAATVTLDVNLTAATATIDINFSDQSVAVFDAAKWFAHNAQEVYVYGWANCPDVTATLLCTRVVPAGKTFFVSGMSVGLYTLTDNPTSMFLELRESATVRVLAGSIRGGGLIFDTPLRFTAGQTANLYLRPFGLTATRRGDGALWGYDEAA